MTTSRNLQSGLSLLELLISSGIASGLLLLMLHMFNVSNAIALEHQRLSRQLANAASVRHLLSHSVRDALHTRLVEVKSDMTGQVCAGIFLNETCYPPMQSWKQGASGPVVSPIVLRDSYLLWVKQVCCPGVIADLWFIAFRGGNNNNPPSLFRRRQFTDGRFSASEEMVEGVASLTPVFTQTVYDENQQSRVYVTGLSPDSIDNWWSIAAAHFHVSLVAGASAHATHDTFSFTIAPRQWSH
ncbi:hypothetical protein E3V39_13185 [Gammaproteobacteria bacterium LSUCC0112]|nr:hypothetical protein E3V39_13185 [Gammaproteobacteria bacterium LSUCC0112]